MDHDPIKQYYGETLAGTSDLKTGACCSPAAMPAHLLTWLGELPRAVTDRFYGCGSPIPAAIEGATVLDLGCGTGRDAYLLSADKARSPVPLLDDDIEARIGMVAFESITVRAFKLDLEDRCEDFGQVATYRGSIAHHPHRFMLDDHHMLERDRPMLVCGNTAAMLTDTRYGAHFEVTPRRSHFGLFGGGAVPATEDASTSGACC